MGNCCCVGTVSSGEVWLIERFGKFESVARPGLNLIAWPMDNFAGKLNMRVQQLSVTTQTKTRDNVSVTIQVAVQYAVIGESVRDAFYKLTDVEGQIRCYVDDVVRAQIPLMELDEAYESKEQVSASVKDALQASMDDYGYNIVKTLVTDLSPAPQVVAAMNEINTAKRLREAAQERAEADKILAVKKAEAEAEAAYLAGTGIARQRTAIVDGMKLSVKEFTETVDGSHPDQIMSMIMATQYIDMMKDLASKGGPKTMFIQHGPSAISDIQNQLDDVLSGDPKKRKEVAGCFPSICSPSFVAAPLHPHFCRLTVLC